MRIVRSTALAVAVGLGSAVQGAAGPLQGLDMPLAMEGVPPVLLTQYREYRYREYKSPRQIECEERGKRRGFDGGPFQEYVRRCMARGGDRYEEQKSPRQIECEERGKRRGFDGGPFQEYVRRCMARGGDGYEERKSPRQIECEERGKRRGLDGGEFQNYVRWCMAR
jgi:hypothetical protein